MRSEGDVNRIVGKFMSKENKGSGPSGLLEKLRHIKALAEQCIEELASVSDSRSPSKKHSSGGTLPVARELNFDAHERAFAKANLGELTGPGKFVLILAYLAKGDTSKEVPVRDVESMWNRMTSLLDGEFNAKYPSVAKERGWVNTKKAGVYVLTTAWQGIFVGK